MHIELFNVFLFMCLTPDGQSCRGVDGSLRVGGDAGVFSRILGTDRLDLQTAGLQQREPGNLDRAAS